MQTGIGAFRQGVGDIRTAAQTGDVNATIRAARDARIRFLQQLLSVAPASLQPAIQARLSAVQASPLPALAALAPQLPPQMQDAINRAIMAINAASLNDQAG